MKQDTAKVCKLALQFMAERAVEPNPRNYSVWYEYVLAENKPLVAEIDRLVGEGKKFDANVSDYLFRRFFADSSGSKVVEESTEQAKLLLNDVAELLGRITSQTGDYGKELDLFTSKMASHNKSDALKPLVDTIINRTKDMSQKSASMAKRLDDSNSEVNTLRKNLAQIKLESSRDFLTGIYNRKAFQEQLDINIAESRATGRPLAFLILDIDHFKKYNDTWGHQLGDEVIKLVASTVADNVRGSDIAGRYGGEEFGVILPDTPIAGALIVAEKLRRTIEAKIIRRKDTGEVCGNVTVSIGVSQYRLGDDEETVMKRADEALYKSKLGGRNKVTEESYKG
jgi:diguanylate cyclase